MLQDLSVVVSNFIDYFCFDLNFDDPVVVGCGWLSSQWSDSLDLTPQSGMRNRFLSDAVTNGAARFRGIDPGGLMPQLAFLIRQSPTRQRTPIP